jgi:hypothetical protein
MGKSSQVDESLTAKPVEIEGDFEDVNASARGRDD